MRILITAFLLTVSQISQGQVLCDSIPDNVNFGDYPPGCFICSDKIRSDNIGYLPDDSLSYVFACGEVENSRWYNFNSNSFGVVVITPTIFNCKNNDGLEISVYDENLNPASACTTLRFGSERSSIYRLRPSQSYYIMIDGIDGDECEFELEVDLDPFRSNPPMSISPNDQNYCIGVEVCFEIEKDIIGEVYDWKVPSNDSIISGGGQNDLEVCIYFKTSGEKKVSVDVIVPCGKRTNINDSIFVKEGQSISLDTIYSNKPRLCTSDTVEFYIDWANPNNLGVDWESNGFINYLAGGMPQDTFLKGVFLSSDTFDISVTPIDECGFKYDRSIPATFNFTNQLFRNICDGFCFQLGDSCYYETVRERINTGLSNSFGCDSIVTLVLTGAKILPSPFINCNPVQDGIMVEWEYVSGADSYKVFIDRDSFTTIADNFIFLENIGMNSMVNVKIQPIGACTYLPAEITCINGISNTINHFTKNEIIVFPNPTTGEINIKTDLKIESVEVFDITGRFLQKENSTSFEMKNRRSGIYFLKIKTNNGVGVKRILVSSK